MIELHVHLEGAIPLHALWTLVQKYGCEDVKSPDALRDRFRYRDFAHFIDTWVWKNQFLREYEDFTFIAEAVAADLMRQNVRYAEMFFSPGDFARHGLVPQRLVEAIRRGFDRCPIRIQLIADLIRDFGPQQGMRWLHEVAEVRHLGVVGIGIGGSEQSFPPQPYAEVFERARQLGFRTTAHAGEAAGPDSIWGALDVLQVDRIGHGTRAVEDPRLMQVLRERQMPLEMCPLSNVRTGVVPDLRSHPIGDMYRAGLAVTVNTDDPSMFGNTLADEIRGLMDVHGFSSDDIRRCVQHAVRAAWCDDAFKAELLGEFHVSAAC